MLRVCVNVEIGNIMELELRASSVARIDHRYAFFFIDDGIGDGLVTISIVTTFLLLSLTINVLRWTFDMDTILLAHYFF